MSYKIKVHIADDHKILIEGVIALINIEDDIEVEGFSLTGREVINWSKKNTADILILDINMPEMDGIDVLKTFQQRDTKIKTIILSSLSDPKLVQEMIVLGANGFLEKSSASEHIVDAIRAVNKGLQYFNEDIKSKLFNLYVTGSKNKIKREESHKDLTERELEVLTLIAQEKSSSEIADKLRISVKTVETYRRSLYKKLKVKNVVGLAMYAVRNNIV
ncbi:MULTISPECIES: response regulator [Tenacibaculum]|uniref:response regulator n=1 Tax=Tenacibaculum TaxID=104267 RepID=UPI000895328E|nr:MULTISPECIES: response regulator transcription factor [unclassified Tenacibaculum]RBW54317.1 DNA-binding response regulator [Tenacibaculum sp. E3R01]SED65645.1 DNA-binding response regulator, NarL/FixJ family, contains REC and HTH domains [Tenacibaculum sp. MAR_2010_89]